MGLLLISNSSRLCLFCASERDYLRSKVLARYGGGLGMLDGILIKINGRATEFRIWI